MGLANGISFIDIAHGISSDTTGSVYVTGHTQGGSLDSNISVVYTDIFVFKYDENGNKQ